MYLKLTLTHSSDVYPVIFGLAELKQNMYLSFGPLVYHVITITARKIGHGK